MGKFNPDNFKPDVQSEEKKENQSSPSPVYGKEQPINNQTQYPPYPDPQQLPPMNNPYYPQNYPQYPPQMNSQYYPYPNQMPAQPLNPYYQGGFYQPNGPMQQQLRPNFTKKELNNVEIPDQIGKEIRSEKLRLVGLMFLGMIAFTISLFFILVHYIVPEIAGEKLVFPIEFIPHPAFMFVLMAFSFIFFAFGFIDYGHLKIDVRIYKSDLLMRVEKVPYFLIRNYKVLTARPIYLNWIAFSIYIFGAITIGIFYAIKAASKNHLTMNTEIIIMVGILLSTLLIHISSLFRTRARKGRLNAYYGYEIIPFDQIKDIRKRSNRICLTVFLIVIALILFAVAIPWLITRRSKGKKLIPFL